MFMTVRTAFMQVFIKLVQTKAKSKKKTVLSHSHLQTLWTDYLNMQSKILTQHFHVTIKLVFQPW